MDNNADWSDRRETSQRERPIRHCKYKMSTTLTESNNLLDDCAKSEDHGGAVKEDFAFSEGHRFSDDSLNKVEKNAIKCSAVHTLERDMPDFDYSHLISELRHKILNEFRANPGCCSAEDIEKCKRDDWFLSRFLLWKKLDIELAFQMMKKAMRYNHESLTSAIRREDFPAEFYLLSGIFPYETDRKGNKTLYMRVKIHRRVPEIQSLLQAFIHQNIKACDDSADGKGWALLIDFTGGGLANVDMDAFSFMLTMLFEVFPKGLSYILIHNMPWCFMPFWYIARGWIPEEYKQLVRFSNSGSILEYVDEDKLPDFMGGTCKRKYRVVPENCETLEQAAKLWGVDGRTVKRLLALFAEHLPAKTLEKADKLCCDVEDLSAENGSDKKVKQEK